jgi:transcriptional regulator with GAF, ATPase, and Fis domain
MAQTPKIDQRYDIVKNLGSGFSGEVLLVQDNDGIKALKFLKKIQLNVSREEALRNFKNEFSILKELNHPNIAPILDFGFETRMQKYYFTTEFIEGAELHEGCKNQPIELIEKIVVQVLRALNYLHSRGIYHFDIKPQNILVYMNQQKPETAKIIDFGLAGYTTPRKKVGTPAFMAPEVIQGGHLDGRTDLYSFGILLYQIFTGSNPFASKNLKESLDRQLKLKPPPPSKVNPDVPKYWDHIIERLLEKNPTHRYSQASLVIRDLNLLSGKKFEVETKDTKLSYLPEKGTLIGREEAWATFAEMFSNVFMSEAIPDDKTLIIEGGKGTGKTRLMSEIKYFSQLRNVPIKTQTQIETQERAKAFILMIDDPQMDSHMVSALAQELATEKCLIIWTTEKAPQDWEDSRIITLTNYSKEELKTYLESVTGLSSAPPKLINEVFKRTQGNPLFVAEFIKILLNNNLLCDESGKWDATTFEDIKINFDNIHLPNNISDILSETYNKLTNKEQETLNWLAINKSDLNIDQLKKLTEFSEINTVILNLIEKDILEKTSREHSYHFKNHSYIDVIYKKLKKQERTIYHDKLAREFKDLPDCNIKYLTHLGYGSDLDKAKKALLELNTIFAATQMNYEQSIEILLRILKISSHDSYTQQIPTYFRLGLAYYKTNNYENAFLIYNKIIEKLKENEDEHIDDLLRAYNMALESVLKLTKVSEAEKLIKEAQNILIKSEHRVMYDLIFSNYKAFILSDTKKIDEAQTLYEKTHRIWENDLEENEKIQVVNNRLVSIYYLKQEYNKAITLCEKNISFLKKTNSKFELALHYNFLGNIYHKLLEGQKLENRDDIIKRCVDSLSHCEKIARENNNYNLLFRALNGLGNLYSDEKEHQKALNSYMRALTVARKIANTSHAAFEIMNAAFIAYNIGHIHTQQKKYNDAYTYLIYSSNTLKNLEGFSPNREEILYLSYIYLAEVHTNNGDFKKCHHALDLADKVLEETELIKHREFWSRIRRAEAYTAAQNKKEAKTYLRQAKKLITDNHEEIEFSSIEDMFEQSFSMQESQLEGVKIMTSTNKQPSGDDLKKIIEINRFINSEHDMDQLFKVILNYALQLSNAEAGFVMLLDAEGELDVKASLNTSESDVEKISMSVAKLAIEKGEIISSSDALSDDRFDSSESIVLNELKSVLCLPIRSKYKSLGVFYLDNRYRINAFEECNVDLLTAFCDQVGIALENSSLINKLMNTQDKLENRLEATTAELDEVKSILKNESETYQTRYAYKSIIAKSEAMQKMFKLLDKVTETNLSIFIHGESGTGKELVAKALHYNNPTRQGNPFVAINCGAIPTNLMESELFGHKAGSFTGANKDKRGLFEEASGGTILLDEIGELDQQLQVKLLRVLQEGEVQRIGDTKTIKVDSRVLCASHKDLGALVKQGKFREDLYYRLCQMKIDISPLKDRTEDIPLLAKHFVQKYKDDNNIKENIEIPPIFMKALLEYEWPGNIRELQNLISVACALKEGTVLALENIPPNYGIKQFAERSFANISMNLSAMSMDLSQHIGTPVDENNLFDSKKTWQQYEAMIITKCYESCEKKKMQTAEKLGVSHSTIYKKISDLNLDDSSNPLYAEEFIYDDQSTMKEYIVMVFKAALQHHENHPYAAIRQLGVSQGYFYKIMKEFKGEAEAEATSV